LILEEEYDKEDDDLSNEDFLDDYEDDDFAGEDEDSDEGEI